ncbi:MAG: hypothetical protein H0V37_02115 [Chloroflexia bacterium]|nr:hypothetical protein [Chloroflexia bacterium]
MTVATSFDPGRHLSLVNGKDYLEVKWRLVWLRSEHPNASIETELVAHANGEAIFRALVTIPDGGSATGWGSEDAQGFGDYIEKAETKAIGRALAALGFGTQFCGDFDFGAAAGRVVDSPVAMAPANMSEGAFERNKPATDIEATYRQRNLIQSLSRELKISANALDELSRELTGQSLEAMSRKNASMLIDALQERRPSRNAIPA